jgi:hypothetical protein
MARRAKAKGEASQPTPEAPSPEALAPVPDGQVMVSHGSAHEERIPFGGRIYAFASGAETPVDVDAWKAICRHRGMALLLARGHFRVRH